MKTRCLIEAQKAKGLTNREIAALLDIHEKSWIRIKRQEELSDKLAAKAQVVMPDIFLPSSVIKANILQRIKSFIGRVICQS